MKTATFAGRIGQDAETRKTNGGDSVTNFSLAVDRPKKQGEKQAPIWVKAVLWGKRGETLAEYLTKGSRVVISGDIDLETYTNKQDATVTQLVCRVDQVTLLGGGQSDADESRAPENKTSEYGF